LVEFEQHGYPLPFDAAERVGELEQQINVRVARLYGLTDAEVATIEGPRASATEGEGKEATA